MGAQHEIYTVPALELGGFVGGTDAAGEGYLLDAALAPQTAQLAEVAADAVHSVLADVARIEDYEIRLLVGVDLSVTRVQDHAAHAVRVVDVHLAAEGAYARRLGASGCAGTLYGSR